MKTIKNLALNFSFEIDDEKWKEIPSEDWEKLEIQPSTLYFFVNREEPSSVRAITINKENVVCNTIDEYNLLMQENISNLKHAIQSDVAVNCTTVHTDSVFYNKFFLDFSCFKMVFYSTYINKHCIMFSTSVKSENDEQDNTIKAICESIKVID